MEAPLYHPAASFVAPRVVPRQLSTAETSIATLLGRPDAMTILERELPGFKALVSVGQLQEHISNFSPRSLVQFGMFQPDALDRADLLLAKLPPEGLGED